MAQCKTAVSPLLTHWRYCSLVLSHRHILLLVQVTSNEHSAILWTLVRKQWTWWPVQDCSISIANALEILQSCTKPSTHAVVSSDGIKWAWSHSLDIGQSGTKPNLVAKILATKFGFVPDCWWGNNEPGDLSIGCYDPMLSCPLVMSMLFDLVT